MILTQSQIDAGAAYLRSCANRNGEIDGGYSWRRIAEITGEDVAKPGAGLSLFEALEDAGRLKHLPCIPGTFGHSRFTVS
ncbi:hypothetical protein [Novosphingobium sp.]|uniref:hypothetical protein n=1 Tax=Novosphingobium sp. TaxID=1874826 RepID=UPI0031D32CEC